MMRQTFSLSIGWNVIVWYDVDCFHTDEIIDDLIRQGCNGDNLRTAKENLWSCNYDNGITFSFDRSSVMVIGKAQNMAQYRNSIDHEKRHLVTHIAQTLHLDPYGEEICYLAGELGQKMWKYEHVLTCPKCLKKMKHWY